MRNVPRLQPKEDRQGCGDDAALTVVELAAATDGIESADREHARSSSEVRREQVGLLIFDFGRMLCYRVNKPGGYTLLGTCVLRLFALLGNSKLRQLASGYINKREGYTARQILVNEKMQNERNARAPASPLR